MIDVDRQRSAPLVVFVLLYIGFCISYIDRAAISLSLVHIGKDFHLSPAALGVIVSTFYLSYAAMQIPGGWIADRWGSKVVVVISIAFWSLFTLLTGFAWSLASLIAIRFIFGLGEGGYPSASVKGIAEAYSRADRPKMSALLVSSNYVGSFIAPLVMAPLILALGWRHAFAAIGVAGIVFAFLYLFVVKGVTPERRSRAAGPAQPASAAAGRATARTLLKMPLMWKVLIVWFGMGIVNKGLDAWMPAYLLTVRHLDLKAVGMLAPLPFVAASISTAIGGWVMTRFFDGREKLLLTGCCVVTAWFVFKMYTAETVAGVIAYQSIAYFFKSFVLAVVIALPTKILPQRLVGTGIGMVNFGGQLSGFVAPAVIGFLVAYSGTYDAAFGFLVVSAAVAALVSMTISAARIRDVHTASAQEA
ncbi:MFS transporter [Trinickia caryophylli]|uniref:Sugar phosphate permease n=1 Tax=Trinickia caryophylli TaxID=28094 RepID=A0A1X7D0Z2_TRICW|nr:MFS transporter [Trinickia caryophylli]PMS13553.1 MFS transporter [Trinickia caryophylli]TRX15281.1 MFS transporter [Trinickia caryophylli]WQE15157.1 MFS transporter [Trinickia caryophylli]SMF06521.1 Sugar phosphate permease [Trinickia caryophylli]